MIREVIWTQFFRKKIDSNSIEVTGYIMELFKSLDLIEDFQVKYLEFSPVIFIAIHKRTPQEDYQH